MPASEPELPDDTVDAVAADVGRALGGDLAEPAVAEQPEFALRDLDDGTNEYIRLRTLLAGDGSSG